MDGLSSFFVDYKGFVLSDVNVNCIGIVERFDRQKMTADVTPKVESLGKRYSTLTNLRVAYYSGNGYFIRPLLKKGDFVFLLVGQGYLEDSLNGDNEEENFLRFSLSNAIVYPSVSKKTYTVFEKEGLLIGTEKAYIQFLEDKIIFKIGDHEVTVDGSKLDSNQDVTTGNAVLSTLPTHTHTVSVAGVPTPTTPPT